MNEVPAELYHHTPNDQQVVAAFNYCLNIPLWTSMPEKYKVRFIQLMRQHRIKMVCFSDRLGFGLKIFTDDNEGTIPFDRQGDEVSVPSHIQTNWKVSDGSWLRCPPEIFQSVLDEVSKPVWAIMNKYGKLYLTLEIAGENEDDPDETDLTDDEKENTPTFEEEGIVYRICWKSFRSSSHKFFDKEKANKIASLCEGVVICIRG